MNNTSTFGLQFIVRHKSKKTDSAGIYLRITVNRKKVEVSTKLHCPVNLWDQSKERVKSDGKFNHHHVNRLIEENRSRVQSIYQELRIKKQLITPTIIKNHFLGQQEEQPTLAQLMDYHHHSQKETLNPLTMLHYLTTYRYLKAFLTEVKKVDDLYLSQIDYKFICDYEAFLRSYQPVQAGHRDLAHNTVMKHLSRFRTLINLAIKLQWMEHYPFKAYKLSYKQTNRKYLTHDELDRIINKELKMERLQLTKDIFVFSCYTGLAYSDIVRLTEDNLHKGIDGNRWIHTQRKKTDTSVRIPLLTVPEQLIDKYKTHPKAVHRGTLFPVLSNQKLNSYLKEIADLCNIRQNLTFHMARHTFATTITLSNGVPVETVSKILGHHRIATTQIYAKVLENKISDDMNTLRNKLDINTSNNRSKPLKQG